MREVRQEEREEREKSRGEAEVWEERAINREEKKN